MMKYRDEIAGLRNGIGHLLRVLPIMPERLGAPSALLVSINEIDSID